MTLETRTLILAPRGRDGELTAALLAQHDLESHVCESGEDLLAEIGNGAGSAIITDECLTPQLHQALAQQLGAQPPWSDFPVLLLATMQGAQAVQLVTSALGNLTVMERPLTPQTLITAVRAALRARRRQYEARAAIQQRDQFLAMLGHELRTPLGAIVLATELAQSDQEREQIEGRLAMIARQSQLLARLVDDLLDVARVTWGKIRLRREAIAVDSLLRGVVAAFGESARTRSIKLELTTPSHATIDADQVRIEQVVNNLIANALKYSPAGTTIEVWSRVVGEGCEIGVRDQGIGIAPDMQSRVFDLFAQVDASLSRSDGGMGIGLTLVDRLVRLHGGTVTLNSQGIGKGTEFIVRLPLATGAPATLATAQPARATDKLAVVVVEDNPDLRLLTATLLEGFDCDVSVADDGPAGIELVFRAQPDLALIDIGLPTLDGFAVARRVRDELGSSVMLVAVTGYGRDQDRQRAHESGFDLFVTKPLSSESVRGVLQQARAGRAR